MKTGRCLWVKGKRCSLRKEKESGIRVKWPNEEKDFTPWLSVNLDSLSSIMGVEMVLEGTEVEVGPYRADIVARLAPSTSLVVIENQLTHADPRHLGQLLTYAARLKAKMGVWVALGYWHTNLLAVRSLNWRGSDASMYFAVRLSLSERVYGTMCPKFDVIEHPKGWQDPVAREFWSFFESQFPEAPKPSFNSGSNMRRGRFDVGRAGLQIVQHFEANFVRVYITGSGSESKNNVKSRINSYRPAIVASVGKLGFLNKDDPHCVSLLEVNTHDRQEWTHMAEWFDCQRRYYEDVLREGAGERS